MCMQRLISNIYHFYKLPMGHGTYLNNYHSWQVQMCDRKPYKSVNRNLLITVELMANVEPMWFNVGWARITLTKNSTNNE